VELDVAGGGEGAADEQGRAAAVIEPRERARGAVETATEARPARAVPLRDAARGDTARAAEEPAAKSDAPEPSSWTRRSETMEVPVLGVSGRSLPPPTRCQDELRHFAKPGPAEPARGREPAADEQRKPAAVVEDAHRVHALVRPRSRGDQVAPSQLAMKLPGAPRVVLKTPPA
jgi:hypothetical protein